MTLNRDHVRALFDVALLDLNPALTRKLQKKKAWSPEALKKALLMRLLVLPAFVVLIPYSVIYSQIDFSFLPIFLDILLLMSILTVVAQNLSTIYTVFYKSRNTRYYFSLPVHPEELFIARILVLAATLVTQTLMILPAYFFFLNRFHLSVFSSLGWTLVYGCAMGVILLCASLIAMQWMAKLVARGQIKENLLTTLSVATTMLFVVLLLVFLNFGDSGPVAQLLKPGTLGPLSGLMVTLKGRFVLAAVMLALVILTVFMVFRQVMPAFFPTIYDTEEVEVKKHSAREKSVKAETGASLSRMLWRYHLKLINHGEIFSVSLMPIFMLVVMTLPSMVGFREKMDFVYQLLSDPGAAAVMSVVTGLVAGLIYFLFGGVNVATVLFSLESENFNYMRAIPLSMRHYVGFKVVFGLVVSSVIPLLLMVPLYLYLRLIWWWPLTALCFLSILLLGVLWSLTFDLNNLYLEWNNVAELFSRGSKAFKGLMFFFFFLGIVVAGGLYVGAWFAISYLGAWVTFAIFFVLWMAIVLGVGYWQRDALYRALYRVS